MKLNYAETKELALALAGTPTIGESALDMADNIEAVDGVHRVFESARETTIKKHNNGLSSISPGDENYTTCLRELHEIELSFREIPELKKLTKKQIDFSKNPSALNIAILRKRGVIER